MESKGIKWLLKMHNNLGTCLMFKLVPSEALSLKAAKMEEGCGLLPWQTNAIVHASLFRVCRVG